MVCDGFVGNVALKTSEGLAQMLGTFLREEFTRNPLRQARRAGRVAGARGVPAPRRPPPLQRRHAARAEGHRGEEPRLGRPSRASAARSSAPRRRCASGVLERITERLAAPRPAARRRSSVMMYSRIVGTGSYLPPRIVTNAGARARASTPPTSGSSSRTGIRQRHIADAAQTSSDLALEASRAALAGGRD